MLKSEQKDKVVAHILHINPASQKLCCQRVSWLAEGREGGEVAGWGERLILPRVSAGIGVSLISAVENTRNVICIVSLVDWIDGAEESIVDIDGGSHILVSVGEGSK